MKRTSAIFVFLITITSSVALAQDSFFGIKGGINLSTYKFSTNSFSITPDRAIKARIGLFYTSKIDEKLSYQIEALYNGTGYKPDKSSGIDKITIHYLAFPFMLKYYVAENFNIHAGPEIAFFLGGKADDRDIDEGVKTLDLGLGIGAEVGLSDMASVGARYTFGLVNTDDTVADVTQKSDNIALTLSLKF